MSVIIIRINFQGFGIVGNCSHIVFEIELCYSSILISLNETRVTLYSLRKVVNCSSVVFLKNLITSIIIVFLCFFVFCLASPAKDINNNCYGCGVISILFIAI